MKYVQITDILWRGNSSLSLALDEEDVMLHIWQSNTLVPFIQLASRPMH